MSANARLVRDYLETVWNQGRTEEAGHFLAEDVIQHNPLLPDGRGPVVGLVEDLRRQTPGLRVVVRRVAADGDLVFTHALYLTGAEDRGTACVDVFRIAGGRIVEHWDVAERVPEFPVGSRPVV